MKITKLFIPKVVESIDENDLKLYFNKFGTILDIKIIKNIAQSKRFAFVTFDDYDSVDKIVSLKNHEIKQVKIIADKSKPKSPTHLNENMNIMSKSRDSKFSSLNKNSPNSEFRITPYKSRNPNYLNNNNNNNNNNQNQQNNINSIYGFYNQAPIKKDNSINNTCGYGPRRNEKNFGLFRFAPYRKT